MFNFTICIDCNLVVCFLSDKCDQLALYVKVCLYGFDTSLYKGL